MAISIKSSKSGATHYAVEFYEKYKDVFGHVVSAEMKSRPSKVEYNLTLVNAEGEELNIQGECTAGYIGEGPSGTYRILKMAGFNIEEDFIHKNNSFKITK